MFTCVDVWEKRGCLGIAGHLSAIRHSDIGLDPYRTILYQTKESQYPISNLWKICVFVFSLALIIGKTQKKLHWYTVYIYESVYIFITVHIYIYMYIHIIKEKMYIHIHIHTAGGLETGRSYKKKHIKSAKLEKNSLFSIVFCFHGS